MKSHLTNGKIKPSSIIPTELRIKKINEYKNSFNTTYKDNKIIFSEILINGIKLENYFQLLIFAKIRNIENANNILDIHILINIFLNKNIPYWSLQSVPFINTPLYPEKALSKSIENINFVIDILKWNRAQLENLIQIDTLLNKNLNKGVNVFDLKEKEVLEGITTRINRFSFLDSENKEMISLLEKYKLTINKNLESSRSLTNNLLIFSLSKYCIPSSLENLNFNEPIKEMDIFKGMPQYFKQMETLFPSKSRASTKL
ncbi:MAG: hypothetical protein JWM09_1456 [Francisellaceae bacterium]|nr:hypothetical protein [Francisellaceae bacterium]